MTVPSPYETRVHVPVVDSERKPRRKMMFFDRAKVLILIFGYLGLAVVAEHGEVPLLTWGEAFANQTRAKSWLLVLAAIELLRQVHYVFSERSGEYHHFWTERVFGAWERFWSRRNPWLRFRLARAVRVGVWLVIINAILASVWKRPFLQNFSYAPTRLLRVLFSPSSGGLPLIFEIMVSLLFSVGSIFFLYYFLSKGGDDLLLPEEVGVTFKDVWGQDKVVSKVQEVVKFLEKPEEIEKKGGYVPGGILLWGPPGTGKTLIAKAIAGETGKPFVSVDPGSFNQMFMGVGILKVKALYRKLRKQALRHGGVIVFFDEADSLGNRGSAVSGAQTDQSATPSHHSCNGLHYVSETTARFVVQSGLHQPAAPHASSASSAQSKVTQIIMGGMGGGGMGTLQALLTEISGMEKPRGFVGRRLRKFLNMPVKKPPKYRILMIMATNLPDALDEALRRPGRIDREFKIDYPTLEGRIRTFEGYLNKIKHALTPDQIERLAVSSPRQSGAVIKDLVNEGVISAMRDGRDVVTFQDLLKARELKTHGMSDGPHSVLLERHMVAIHEAGHAVAMKVLYKRFFIDIATIERRGPVGGFVSPVPLEEEMFPWKHMQEDEVMTFMASLAAERHFFNGDNSVGVGGDMRSWTAIVASMVSSAAMGETLANPTVYLASRGEKSSTHFDEQIESKLQELYARTVDLVRSHEVQIMGIAHALEQHHTINGEDINAIFTGGKGPLVDGGWYQTEEFQFLYRRYHAAAVEAHVNQTKLEAPFPTAGTVVVVQGSAPFVTPELGSGPADSGSSVQDAVIDVDSADGDRPSATER
jgi:cell division protease FtsH